MGPAFAQMNDVSRSATVATTQTDFDAYLPRAPLVLAGPLVPQDIFTGFGRPGDDRSSPGQPELAYSTRTSWRRASIRVSRKLGRLQIQRAARTSYASFFNRSRLQTAPRRRKTAGSTSLFAHARAIHRGPPSGRCAARGKRRRGRPWTACRAPDHRTTGGIGCDVEGARGHDPAVRWRRHDHADDEDLYLSTFGTSTASTLRIQRRRRWSFRRCRTTPPPSNSWQPCLVRRSPETLFRRRPEATMCGSPQTS